MRKTKPSKNVHQLNHLDVNKNKEHNKQIKPTSNANATGKTTTYNAYDDRYESNNNETTTTTTYTPT